MIIPITHLSVHFYFLPLPLQFLTFKIAITLILEHTCLYYVSQSRPTKDEALDKAYSQYMASGVHNAITMQFAAPPSKYSISQLAEFILKHRL